MSKLMQRLTFILFAVLLMGASAGWERLGRLNVAAPADHDTLSVPNKVGPLRELMLEPRGGSIEVRDVTITFDDGNTFKPNAPSRLSERSKGYVINLPGKRRRVRQIDFTYAAAHNKQNVQLTVYGR